MVIKAEVQPVTLGVRFGIGQLAKSSKRKGD